MERILIAFLAASLWREGAKTRSATLVEANVEKQTFGLIGQPHVNILQLNLALDQLKLS